MIQEILCIRRARKLHKIPPSSVAFPSGNETAVGPIIVELKIRHLLARVPSVSVALWQQNDRVMYVPPKIPVI
jgi:hypothetical protein